MRRAIAWLVGILLTLLAPVAFADPASEVAALVQQSRELYSQGKLQEAIAPTRAALKIQEASLGPTHPDVAGSLNNLGALLTSTGDYAGAVSHYERALAICKQAFGVKHEYTAQILHNLGGTHGSMGDYPAATRYYEQALAIRQEVLGERNAQTAETMADLGDTLSRQGDYGKGRPLQERALIIRAEVLGNKHPDVATSLDELGGVNLVLGNYPNARICFERALAIRTEVLGKDHPRTAATLNSLGIYYDYTRDYQQSKRYFEQALAIRQQALGEKHRSTAESLSNVGSALSKLDDYAGARKLIERALAIRTELLGPKHPSTIDSLDTLGYVQARLGDRAAALAICQQALTLRQEVLGDAHPETAASFDSFCTLQAAAGDWPGAIHSADSSRHIVRRHVARVLPGIAEREQLEFLRRLDDTYFHASLSLALTRPTDRETCDLSAGWLINGKSMTGEALAARALVMRDIDDPQLADAVRQLLATRQELAALSLTVPASGEEAAHREALIDLQIREEKLSRQLGLAANQDAERDPWVQLPEVRQALAADSVLVDIARFDVYDYEPAAHKSPWRPARYVAWIIPPAGDLAVQLVDLGEADAIDKAVEALRLGVQDAGKSEGGTIAERGEQDAEKQLAESLGKLSSLVLAPLAKHVAHAREIVLSPDANLWLVPWAALRLPDGRYAVEQHQFRYVVSGRDLVSKTSGRKTANPVVMADPNFDLAPPQALEATRAVLRGAQTRSASANASSAAESLLPKVFRLPGTAVEAKLVEPKLAEFAKAAPTIYTDRYALEGVFKALESPQVVVLSTHGFFLADQEHTPDGPKARGRQTAKPSVNEVVENPLLRCGLLLAGCNSRGQAQQTGDDGVLTGMEIIDTDLRGTELVVLSACETGIGQVHNGEGVAGLRQAFQLAGAQSIVATLWQIPDRESAKLMSDFFTNLAAGQPKAQALRSAQLALIQSRREKYSAAHPFFWAAFTITGGE